MSTSPTATPILDAVEPLPAVRKSSRWPVLLALYGGALAYVWLVHAPLIPDVVFEQNPFWVFVSFTDLDPELLATAVAVDDGSVASMRAHLLAYAATCERDRNLASSHLETALRSSTLASAAERRELTVEAVVYNGWYARNGERAERWMQTLDGAQLSPLEHTRVAAVRAFGSGDFTSAHAHLDEMLALVERARATPAAQTTAAAIRGWQAQLGAREAARAIESGGV